MLLEWLIPQLASGDNLLQSGMVHSPIGSTLEGQTLGSSLVVATAMHRSSCKVASWRKRIELNSSTYLKTVFWAGSQIYELHEGDLESIRLCEHR